MVCRIVGDKERKKETRRKRRKRRERRRGGRGEEREEEMQAKWGRGRSGGVGVDTFVSCC